MELEIGRSFGKRWRFVASLTVALGVWSGAVAQVQEKAIGEAEGVVRGVDASEHKLMITHGPVSGALEMPAMTMSFRAAPEVDFSKLEKGEKIRFTVTRDENGRYLITRVSPGK